MAAADDIWTQYSWPTGWSVHHVAETGSTNADLLDGLADGRFGDRSVLVTGHQTAGRGRLDRRWEAPPGANLLVSVAFVEVPDVPAELTHRVGLAAVMASRRLLPAHVVGLKWPNDVLVDDRKLAGILAQRAPGSGAVVVGLGLNVGWAPEGAACIGEGVSPATVLAAVLTAYDELPADVGELYRDHLLTLGRTVRVELATADGASSVVGRAVDVDDDGRLVVLDGCAVSHRFDVGDVVHVRPNS